MRCRPWGHRLHHRRHYHCTYRTYLSPFLGRHSSIPFVAFAVSPDHSPELVTQPSPKQRLPQSQSKNQPRVAAAGRYTENRMSPFQDLLMRLCCAMRRMPRACFNTKRGRCTNTAKDWSTDPWLFWTLNALLYALPCKRSSS